MQLVSLMGVTFGFLGADNKSPQPCDVAVNVLCLRGCYFELDFVYVQINRAMHLAKLSLTNLVLNPYLIIQMRHPQLASPAFSLHLILVSPCIFLFIMF